MTQEEKAKAYDEAIKEASVAHKDEDKHLKATLERIFPELKESEDEEIRKSIIAILNNYVDNSNTFKSKMITWLEKQAEQKSIDKVELIDYNSIDPHFGKPIDKVEPIFNVGDKIQYSKGCGTIMTIEKIENDEYIFGNNMGHTTIENGNKWYLVNHVDQKYVDWSEEQIKKNLQDNSFRKMFEQNPAWGEEMLEEQVNEEFINTLGTMLNDGLPDRYLVSEERIKKSAELLFSIARKQLKNEMQEWSEEDEQIILSIEQVMNCASFLNIVSEKIDKIRSWLKSLKERYTWKPSDKQMKALKEACDEHWEPDGLDPLYTLYQDLKKQRGD